MSVSASIHAGPYPNSAVESGPSVEPGGSRSNDSRFDSRRLQLWTLIALVCLGVVAAGWLGWRTLLRSAVVIDSIEDHIERSSGLLVDIHTVTPGLTGVELHGFRARDEERAIEIWADVVRLDLDVAALREPREHDLPVQLDGVEITLPKGRVFRSKRMWVLRRADGVVESRGKGLMTGASGSSEGRVKWDVTTDEALSHFEGLVSFDAFPAVAAQEIGEHLAQKAVPVPSSVDLRDALLDGEVRFEGDRSSTIEATGRMGISNLTLEHDRLAEQPIRSLQITLDGHGTWSAETRQLGLEDATLSMNGVEIRVQGRILAGARGSEDEAEAGGTRLEAGLTLARTGCDDAFAAIPTALLGPYSDFQLGGELAAEARLVVDTAKPDDTDFDIAVDDQCVFLGVPERARLERLDGPFRLAALDEKQEPFIVDTGPGTDAWSPYEAISPFLVQAVMAHEDATFPEHHGFAVFAIENSLEANLRSGEFVRGASTISMQLAKNLFLDREKTAARKVKEVLLTWWLEKRLGKRDIMELYLNVIEYGPRIYGVRQAARHYFQVEPSELTPAQSVFLATLLPSPVSSHRQLVDGRLFASTRREIGFLLRHMHKKGRIQRAALEYGMSELAQDDFFHRSWSERWIGPDRPVPSAALMASLDSPSRRSSRATPVRLDSWSR